GGPLSSELATELQQAHAEAYSRRMDQVRPLPGAQELLDDLTDRRISWAIATSGRQTSAAAAHKYLEIPDEVPVVTRDDVEHAKPDPDLFVEAALRLGEPITDAVVVGDSVWDLLAARRANALGVGLLSGGYGEEERVGARGFPGFGCPA